MPRRPTMSDVARLAGGFHPSTVSLALRNDPSISEETRKLIKKVARKIGYRPDPLLDAFNNHRKGVLPLKSIPVIAFVADFESRDELEASPLHRGLLDGARKSADLLHCKLEIFLCGKGQLSPERINGILEARGIAAVILAALRSRTTRFALDWKAYCAVAIESQHLPDAPSFMVRSDEREAARIAIAHLLALGYRRPGLALVSPGAGVSTELYKVGYLIEQEKLPKGDRVPIFERAPADVASWLKKHQVDAVISDVPNLAALLDGAGESQPRIAFASLDASSAAPEVAGVIPDHPRVGAQSVDQVVGLMRANQRGLAPTKSCTFVPVSWREGASAPKAG